MLLESTLTRCPAVLVSQPDRGLPCMWFATNGPFQARFVDFIGCCPLARMWVWQNLLRRPGIVEASCKHGRSTSPSLCASGQGQYCDASCSGVQGPRGSMVGGCDPYWRQHETEDRAWQALAHCSDLELSLVIEDPSVWARVEEGHYRPHPESVRRAAAREWLRRWPERPCGYKGWAQLAHTRALSVTPKSAA